MGHTPPLHNELASSNTKTVVFCLDPTDGAGQTCS